MSRYSDYNFKLQRGCRPCNFKCDCCKNVHSRCCSGVDMLYQGDEFRATKILCEGCHKRCSPDQNCQIINDET